MQRFLQCLLTTLVNGILLNDNLKKKILAGAL